MNRRNKRKITMSPATVNTAIGKRQHLWIICILCVLGFLIYANTFTSTFHFDDFSVIVNNSAIRNLWDTPAIFNAFNTRFIPGWTFAVNYAIGQLNVFGYHFFNIGLHICNALLVYIFILQILNLDRNSRKMSAATKMWIGSAAALIFLTHPIQTQAVNYIWQRATLCAFFFYLGTIILYIHGRTQSSQKHYQAALACCLAAMFSKEISFTLPVMIFFIEWIFLRHIVTDKRSLIKIIPFLLMLLIIPFMLQRSAGLTLKIMRPHDMTRGVSEDVMTRKDYILTQVNVTRTYLRLFFCPINQNIDYDYPRAYLGGIWFSSLILLTLIAITGILFLRSCPLISLIIFWFFLTLSVESFVTSIDLLFEHRLYLPMAGLSFGFALALYKLIYIKNVRIATLLVFALSLILGIMTFKRNAIWQNDVKLWGDALQKSPRKARSFNNRGVAFKKMGFFNSELALKDLNKALELTPNYPRGYYNRGKIYASLGEIDQALTDFNKAIELNSKNNQYFIERGILHSKQKELTLAISDFNTAINLKPDHAGTYNNRGVTYQKMGNLEAALEDYNRALALNPNSVQAYINRGNILKNLKRYQESLNDLLRAKALGFPVDPSRVSELQELIRNPSIN